jgi:hypothetical protein
LKSEVCSGTSTGPRIPKRGDIVFYRTHTGEGHSHDGRVNGSRIHPAIVNAVWGSGPHPCMNLTVLYDIDGPKVRTSVQSIHTGSIEEMPVRLGDASMAWAFTEEELG